MMSCVKSPRSQAGAILIISLIMLVILTSLGVSIMQGSVIEHKLATHQRDVTSAMQAAEIAMRTAENTLKDRQNQILWDDFENAQNNAGLYPETPPGTSEPWTQKATWTGNGSILVNIDVSLHAQQPRYIIERIGEMDVGPDLNKPEKVKMVRITAIGYGSSAQSRIMLQANYRW
ncbi:MAG: PilX N-terminal domain-containing pilus assembly protein [Gammaproteobacteria bacterium]|nr:PilX N-terminal domain-containing pilus assembly protein [Gammaproteobacteria bacterium]